MMGAIMSVYSQVLERELAKGVGMEKAHDIAVKESSVVGPVKSKKPDVVINKSKPGIIEPTSDEREIIKQRLAKQYPGDNWVPGMKKKIKKEFETQRTKKVSGQLKNAGLTDEEIEKFK